MNTIFKESLDVISFIVKNKKIEKIKLDDSIKPYGYSREYKSFDYDKIRNELDNIGDKSLKMKIKIG